MQFTRGMLPRQSGLTIVMTIFIVDNMAEVCHSCSGALALRVDAHASPRRRSVGVRAPLLLSLALWTAPVWSVFLTGCMPEPEPEVIRRVTTFWTDDAELYPYVEAMTVRLARATGRDDIRMDRFGSMPVLFDSPIMDLDSRVCAVTKTVVTGRPVDMRIDPDPPAGKCMGLPATLVHEGFHTLAPSIEHSASGIFAKDANSTSYIDGVSLAQLCEGFKCLLFQPEE